MAKVDGNRSELIKRVVSHFDGLARCSMSVPEWGEGDGLPLIVYWSRWTVAEWQKVNAKMTFGDSVGNMVNVIILKAEDASGAKLFTLEDKPELIRHASAAVIERVAKTISLDAEIRVDDAEKK